MRRAYTLAMLLDHAGVEGFIEATDIDATALNRRAIGIYPISATVELPAALLTSIPRARRCREASRPIVFRTTFGRASISHGRHHLSRATARRAALRSGELP